MAGDWQLADKKRLEKQRSEVVGESNKQKKEKKNRKNQPLEIRSLACGEGRLSTTDDSIENLRSANDALFY